MDSITVNISNFNGMRNSISGKGRLQRTIESLITCYPQIVEMDVRITDNDSTDRSWEYTEKLPFGIKRRMKRVHIEPPWLATTINTMNTLRDTILHTDKDYIWNIENDSFFYGHGNFVRKALEVLKLNPDISIVHLRRWTNICARDLPGVPTNLSRFDEIRSAPSGFTFYVLEKRPEYCLWIPVERSFDSGFVPDSTAGYGKCPIGVEATGAIRTKNGRYERLLTEHWNSYTNHGWIGRRKDFVFLFDRYSPLGERQISIAFKKHYRAARLDEDGFICFGWKARATPTEKEGLEVFESYSCGGCSISDFGRYRPSFEAGNLSIPEDKLDVYN